MMDTKFALFVQVIFLSVLFIINSSATPILSDNFEDGNLAGWIQGTANNWANTTNSPITDLRSMQHNLSNTDAVSYVYTNLSANTEVHSTWRFNLKNDWTANPSSDNKFWVYLIANENNLTNNTVDGYAVGVNFDEMSDLLKLWRVTDGAAEETIIESTFTWGANDTVGIEISLSPDGIWDMRYNEQGGFSNMTFAGTATDTNYPNLLYFGLYYKFTSTRASKLWWDDISIIQDEAPSNMPPDLLIAPPATTRSVAVNEQISIIVSAFEIAADSNDLITLSASSLPSGASFPEVSGTSPLTNTFSWIPTQAGIYSVTFNATDNDGTNSITVNINVVELDPGKVWINEFHYDNASTDSNEGVEIAGYAGTSLDNYQLLFYNGANGEIDMTLNLSGTIDDEDAGFGAIWFTQVGIQNGAPDGIALVSHSTNLHQFISYEGTFTAIEGPAAGIESVNTGVSEPSTRPIGESLQLIGTGAAYADFSWTGPTLHSRGLLNVNQIIKPPGIFIIIR